MKTRLARRSRTLLGVLALAPLALVVCKDKGETTPPETKQQYAPVEATCEYVIMIEGARGETRAYTYALEGRETGVPATAKLLASKSSATGLETLTKRPDAAVEVLTQVMEGDDGALAAVPADCHESTPVTVMATAGMRRVAAKDGETAGKRMYEALTAYLESKFLDVRVVGTLSGDEQALFSWISVNYALGSLAGEQQTSAALELNDETLQVAFVPDEPEASDTEPVLFGGREHMVYRKSFLGYGARAARDAHASKACYPKGLEGGKGDYGTCRKELATLLKPETCQRVKCSAAKPGSRDGAYQPGLPAGRTFYAFGEFAEARALLSLAEDATPGDFAAAGASFCGTPWSELSAPPAAPAEPAGGAPEEGASGDAPAEAAPDPKQLEPVCFESAWIPAFVEQLGFKPDARDIRWQSRFGDKTELPASWVLGAAVCLASECR